jgi:hypothetical protein
VAVTVVTVVGMAETGDCTRASTFSTTGGPETTVFVKEGKAQGQQG